MSRYPSWAAGLALTAALTPFASAEPTGNGVLNAVAYNPVPAEPVAVRVLDDSDENLAIKGDLENALTRRGFRLGSDDSPLVMTIDTGDQVGAWQSSPVWDRFRVQDDQRRLWPGGELDVQRVARYPIPRTTVVTPPQYRLGVTLDDRGSGVRLWEGWAFAELSQGDPRELAHAMVPRLAGSVGQTVREESFPLQ